VVAIPVSTLMSVVLNNAFAQVFFKTPPVYVPDASGMLLWLALVVGVSVLSCAWPAMRATRISAREALAYE
jgi:putative ABC transport system permease protein